MIILTITIIVIVYCTNLCVASAHARSSLLRGAQYIVKIFWKDYCFPNKVILYYHHDFYQTVYFIPYHYLYYWRGSVFIVLLFSMEVIIWYNVLHSRWAPNPFGIQISVHMLILSVIF